MSEENVELARAAVAALNRKDFDAAFRYASPDAEIDLSRAVGLDQGVYSLDRFRRVTEEFTESWESVRYRVDDYIDAGEHVVTPFTNLLRGRDGIEVQAPRHLALDYPGRRNCADLPLSGAARGTRRCWT